jgi:hypothetical protein
MTSYSNSKTLYVNAGKEDADADGITVPALSYVIQ